MIQIEDGWTAFAPVSEWSILLATHADEWRISYLNRDYKICNSYPSAFIVPRQVDDKVIMSSANFRDGARFPVLCYRHEGGVSNCTCTFYKNYIYGTYWNLRLIAEHIVKK